MSPVFDLQVQFRENGIIRWGDKVKGHPQSLRHFRLTSASKAILDDAAANPEIGGTVQAWKDAPTEGMWEHYTETDKLHVILPPVFSKEDGAATYPCSQWYEQWSGGGCLRRCDGITEQLSGRPCLCNKEERECALHSRFSFMLPDLLSIGIWRANTSGKIAATVLPATIAYLHRAAEEGRFIRAEFRLEEKIITKPGEPKKKFVVPVLDVPSFRLSDYMLEDGTLALNAPAPRVERPALPSAGSDLPEDPSFQDGQPGFGETPDLPTVVFPGPLATRLLDLAWELGVREETAEMIARNIEQNEGDMVKHEAWLGRQIKSAEKKLQEQDGAKELFAAPVLHEDRG